MLGFTIVDFDVADELLVTFFFCIRQMSISISAIRPVQETQ
jgi:hypothetical protein